MALGKIIARGSDNRILVFLPVFASVVSLVFSYLFAFELGYPQGGITSLAFGALYLLPLLLYRLQQVTVGKHLLALLFLGSVVVHSFLLFPIESYFHLFLVSAFPLVFMVFDDSENRTRALYSIAIAVLLMVILFSPDDGIRPVAFLPADMVFLRNNNLVASFLLLSVCSIMYIRSVEKRASESSRLATTDVLTGLGNRRYFSHLAEHEISQAERYKTELSLLFIDIDDFKAVNDTKGHHVGDLVLRGVAQGMRKHGRASDVLARTGGDEFQVLLPGANLLAASQVAKAMRSTIFRECLAVSGEEVRVSIGVAQYENGDTVDMLAARADQGLYQDKTDFKLMRDDTTPLRKLVG